MKGYLLVLDCPRCGTELEHINSTVDPAHGIAVAKCEPCRVEYVVSISLRTKFADSHAQAGGIGSKPRRQVYA